MASTAAAIQSVVPRSSFLGAETQAFRGDAIGSTSAAPALPPMRTSSSLRANKNSPFSNKSAPAQGAQKLVGYKGSTMPGSAPPRRDGKPGVVYRLKAENGKMNVDEYSPIFTPEKWSPTGDTYAPGLAGIALWAITFTTVIGGAAYLVVNTSALGA